MKKKIGRNEIIRFTPTSQLLFVLYLNIPQQPQQHPNQQQVHNSVLEIHGVPVLTDINGPFV